MTNAVLLNKVDNAEVVLWQYDKAYNLIALIGKFGEAYRDWDVGDLGQFNKLAKAATQDLWDFVRDYLLPLNEHIDDDMDEFALTVWGRILGLSWPTYKDESKSTKRISNDFFRRILKGRFFLLNMPPTAANYNKYLNIVFPFSDSKKVMTYEPHCTDVEKVNEFVDETKDTINWAITGSSGLYTIVFSGYDTSKWSIPNATYGGGEPNGFVANIMSADEAVSYGYIYCTSRTGTPCHVIDGGTSMPNETGRTSIDNTKFMSMGFSRPTGASEEELAIINQNPDLIYIYPAGIRYDGGYADSAKVIGFTGQALNNFADGFAWADDDANGGIFAGTDKANFPPTSGGAS